MKPRDYQKAVIAAFKDGGYDQQLIWSGRRLRDSGKLKILRIIWAIGTASSEVVRLQMGDKMHSEVYRLTLTTMFPGCVTAHDDTILTISTQCVRSIIEEKGAEALMNIDEVIQKSVAEYEKQRYNTDNSGTN